MKVMGYKLWQVIILLAVVWMIYNYTQKRSIFYPFDWMLAVWISTAYGNGTKE